MAKIKKNTYLYFFTTSYASGKKKIIFFRKEKSFFLLIIMGKEKKLFFIKIIKKGMENCFLLRKKICFYFYWRRIIGRKEWKIVFIFINAFRNFIYMNFFFWLSDLKRNGVIFLFCLCPFLEC